MPTSARVAEHNYIIGHTLCARHLFHVISLSSSHKYTPKYRQKRTNVV